MHKWSRSVKRILRIKIKGKDKKKYNFQGQSAISILWFDFDHEWLEENFKTHESAFYKKLYQKNIRGNETKTYSLFLVTIGNAKIS